MSIVDTTTRAISAITAMEITSTAEEVTAAIETAGTGNQLWGESSEKSPGAVSR